MPTGTVKRYFDERGFGFLKPDGAGEELFFHVKSFVDHLEPHETRRLSLTIKVAAMPTLHRILKAT